MPPLVSRADRFSCATFFALTLFILLWTPALLAAGKTSVIQIYFSPDLPTYVDTVTAIVQVRDYNTGIGINEAGSVSVSVDGGAPITASLTESTGYVNLGRLSIASHNVVATFPGNADYAASTGSEPITTSDASLTFVGTQSTTLFVDGSVFSVQSAAVDGGNNLYIADAASNNVQKEDVYGTVTTLPFTGLSGPHGITVDASNNVYVVDSNNNRVEKMDSAGHQTTLSVAGLTTPTYIIYDSANGDLYIADPTNGRIVKFDPATSAQSNAVTGLAGLRGIGLDAYGNLLYADRFAGFNKVQGDGSLLPIFASVVEPAGITGDAFGNLYVSDAAANVLLRIDSLGNQVQVNDAANPPGFLITDNLGRLYVPLGGRVDVLSPASGRVSDAPVNLGTSNSLVNAIFQVPQANPPFTVTVGPAKTFNMPSGVGCAGIGACGVTFYFDPQWAGLNTGTATVTQGNSSSTVALSGNGIGGDAAFTPGLPSQLASGSTAIGGVALDLAGNRYVTDSTTKTVRKVSPTGASSTLAFAGLSAPTQVAVDSSGGVYVLDTGLNQILRLDPSGTQTVSLDGTSESIPLTTLTAFALDGDSNMVIAGMGVDDEIAARNTNRKIGGRGTRIHKAAATPNDSGDYAVARAVRQDLPSVELSSDGQFPVDSMVAASLSPVNAVAIDAYGYIYALEASGELLSFDTLSNEKQLATGLTGAIGLGVDAAQTAYVAQSNKGEIAIIHSDKTTGTLALNGLYNPASLAIDAFGDLLVGDAADKHLLFLDRTQQNYAFGNVAVGTPSTLPGSVANVGNQSFAFTGTLPADGTFAPGTGSTECNPAATPATVLARAASCDLSYIFTPPALGPFTYSGNLSTTPNTLFDSAGLGGMQFSGTGVAATAAATLTPATFSYGSILVGENATTTLTLTNTGPIAISIASETLTNTVFSLASKTCGATLAQGASCTYTLVFTPTAAGAQLATFSVTDDAGTQASSLSGTGTVPVTAPAATLTPATLGFGTVTTGSKSMTQTATLTNTGNAALAISGITLSGTDATVFSSTSTCGTSLAAAARCTISVVFAPTAAGAETATLTVADNAPGSPQTSALSGTGSAPAVAPADFGITGTPAAQSVADGAAATYTMSINSLDGTFTQPVALTATGLPAGATVTFTPASVTPGSAGATSKMVIQTAAQSAFMTRLPRKNSTMPRWPFAAPALAAVFLFIPSKRLRRWKGFLSLGLFSITLASLGGCGGGFGLPATSPTSQTYPVTVTGTSGSLTHSTSVQMTVTQNAKQEVAE